MAKMNGNQVTYSEFCEFFGFNAEELLKITADFTSRMTETNAWRTAPSGAKEDICGLLEIMKADGVIPEDKLELMEFFGRIILRAAEEVGGDMTSIAERIDDQPQNVQTMVNASITFNEAAESMKKALCREMNGPSEFPANIVYITPINGHTPDPSLADLNSENYHMHVTQVDVEDGDDALNHVRELLSEAFEALGAPVMIAMTCDTFMREFDSADEATSEAGREFIENMEELFIRPGSNVCQAIASIVVAKGAPVVTTISKYSYDDNGQPEFVLGGSSYSVNDPSDILQDPSHRGQVCSLFLSYLNLGDTL